MSSKILNDMHLANQKRWDASAKRWAECTDSRGIWKRCHEDPSIVFSPTVLKYLSDIKGKKVAVLGSGDNEAVFALAGLGAKVTSVDISTEQLQYAAERAAVLKERETSSKEMVAEIERKTKRYNDIISFREMQDRINSRATNY